MFMESLKSSVHFHEASSIDTVIDIIGTAIALDDLNICLMKRYRVHMLQ